MLRMCILCFVAMQRCAVVTKSENLNFLEPSGPLQACNGTSLPLPVIIAEELDGHRHEDRVSRR